jgi:hypothetical protein
LSACSLNPATGCCPDAAPGPLNPTENGKNVTVTVTVFDTDAVQLGVPLKTACTTCVPKKNTRVVVAVPVVPLPVTRATANGSPLSVKVTVPPTGVPAVQVTFAVKVTGVRMNGVVVDAVSVVVDVPGGVTVTVTGADAADAVQVGVPLNVAVTAFTPTGSAVVVKVAVPARLTGTVPRTVLVVVLVKVTVPPAGLPLVQVTVAVRVTGRPATEMAAEVVSVVVDVPRVTVTVVVPVDAAQFASPR